MAMAAEIVAKGRGLPSALVTLAGRPMPATGRGAAVLCYHDIGVNAANTTDYYVSPERLRSHLEWIRSWGLTFVPLAELVDRLLDGRDLDGLVAVTFDDALMGVQEYAAPLLSSLGVPATVFAVTDGLGVARPFWPGAARTMSPAELGELTASGLITLGSHTCTHPSLPDISSEDRARELHDSRVALEAIAGTTVDLLAYPSGHHDADTEQAAMGAGYRAAFTFSFGRVTRSSPPMAIPRFCIGPAHDRFRLARQLGRPPRAW